MNIQNRLKKIEVHLQPKGEGHREPDFSQLSDTELERFHDLLVKGIGRGRDLNENNLTADELEEFHAINASVIYK